MDMKRSRRLLYLSRHPYEVIAHRSDALGSVAPYFMDAWRRRTNSTTDVFMLSYTTVLNTKTVAEILRMGYTRIPVFDGDRNNVVSLLFVKDLALLDPDDNFTIQTVCGYHQHPLRFVMEDTPLRVMLEEFKKGDYHLAMVQRIVYTEDSDPTYELVGVVTLEDIVEEILQAEIVDETDAIMDNVNRTRRRGAQASAYGFRVEKNFSSSEAIQESTQFLASS
ncbi:hypothetical protein RB195_023401 [Necator americanus]|uniref:CBS domain-containing protein n=1 Tax=Necator americanus TaxID=51031 RepID=A0ABR1EJ66_NECAM